MITGTENKTITDYSTYQVPRNNFKNLIGNQEKMKNVIVNDDRYFGTSYWLRKIVFLKDTRKLQQLTDQEVQNINDYKENKPICVFKIKKIRFITWQYQEEKTMDY